MVAAIGLLTIPIGTAAGLVDVTAQRQMAMGAVRGRPAEDAHGMNA